MPLRRTIGACIAKTLKAIWTPKTAHNPLTAAWMHGRYIGFNPTLAARGISFENCRVNFSLDSAGCILYERVLSHGQICDFHIHYPPSHITQDERAAGDKEDTGAEHRTRGASWCLSLRHNITAKTASRIISYTPDVFATYQAIMVRNNGIPAVIGLFKYIGSEAEFESKLSALHTLWAKSYRTPHSSADRTPQWLIEMNVETARDLMRVGPLQTKIRLITSASHNLWAGSSEEAASRFTIITLGLNDPDPNVIIAALHAIKHGGRVTYAVPHVVRILAHYQTLEPTVLAKVLDTASSLLHAASRFNTQRAELVRVFGSAHIPTIHTTTGGSITPYGAELIAAIVDDVPSHLTWTLVDQAVLINSITRIIEDPDFTHLPIIRGSLQSVVDYPLPT